MEKVYYPPVIREIAPASSEAVSDPEEAEIARFKAALAVSIPDEPAEGGELPGVIEIHGSSNPEAPQEGAESIVSALASHAEELAILVQPFRPFPQLMSPRALRLILLSSLIKGPK